MPPAKRPLAKRPTARPLAKRPIAGSVRKVTRESQTKRVVGKYERKLELMGRYADQGRLSLLLSHGEYQGDAIATKFKVPEGQLIVFVSKTGVYLPQKIVDQKFYEIFGDKRNVSDLLTRKTFPVPWYLKGFRKRTYGPGDQCPNLTLHMSDPAWGGMGIHPLPLKARLEGPGAPPGAFHGQTKKLRDLAGRGVLFVVACRAVVGRVQSPTFFHAPNYTLRTGAHLPDERILQRFNGKTDVGATREVRRARRQLREAIRRSDPREPMNIDGMPSRTALAGMFRKRAATLRKKRRT